MVSAETRCQFELAPQLNEQQLIRGVLWDVGGTAAYREAEKALNQAKELFLAATEALRQSAERCLVFV